MGDDLVAENRRPDLSGSDVLPTPFSLQGYVDAFSQVNLERYLLNTVIYAVGGTVGALTTGLPRLIRWRATTSRAATRSSRWSGSR